MARVEYMSFLNMEELRPQEVDMSFTGCMPITRTDTYTSTIEDVPESPHITVKRLYVMDEGYDIYGRWDYERIEAISNFIKLKTYNGEKYNSILIPPEYETAIIGSSGFTYMLDEWVDHDIIDCVECFGYISDLEVYCFKYNFQRDILEYETNRDRYVTKNVTY